MFLSKSFGLPVTLKVEDIEVCFHDDEKHLACDQIRNSLGEHPAILLFSSLLK